MESGADLALLSEEDVVPPPLPESVRDALDKEFPRKLVIGEHRFSVRYELDRGVVVLEQTSGKRPDPPPPRMLPAFRGFGVESHFKGRVQVMR